MPSTYYVFNEYSLNEWMGSPWTPSEKKLNQTFSFSIQSHNVPGKKNFNIFTHRENLFLFSMFELSHSFS
jgi:hypothetical protein